MLSSCVYCGRIHDNNALCEHKKSIIDARGKKHKSKEDKYRGSYDWVKTREKILKRDRFLCVVCNKLNGGNFRKFNSDLLEVHHIIPIKEDFSRRNNPNNLITVCRRHHEECEKGVIDRNTQKSFIFNSDYDFEVIV